MIGMPGSSFRGSLPELTAEGTLLRSALQKDVEVLSDTIGERNLSRRSALDDAAAFVETSLSAAGYSCSIQEYRAQDHRCRNIEATHISSLPQSEIVVVGAHYDSVVGSPGANDNASGVAALLALARNFSAYEGSRELRFVAFANEEPPHFQTSEMGSLVYAKRCRARGELITGMMCLETIGYYTKDTGSQRYPFPLSLFYPSTGDFVGFVGNRRSASLVRTAVAAFRENVRFPSEGAVLPSFLPGIGWSDHWSFWSQGYRAFMVTDTVFYRYPHYHQASDTADKLNFDSLARVVGGLIPVIQELAGIGRAVCL